MDFERKKKRFLDEVDGIYELMKTLPWVILAGITFVGLLAIFGVFSQDDLRAFPKGDRNQFISPTKVDAVSKKGLVGVPLKTLLEKKMISFAYSSNGNRIPLLAYQAPTGKIVTAIGLSEACGSLDFHIEGAEIVCDLCQTRWNLESLKGVVGECQRQPLEMVAHFIHRGYLFIKATDIQKNNFQMVGERAWISA